MRRVRKTDLVVEAKRGWRKGKDQVQAELHFIDENEPVKSWEYAVLVCNAHYELKNIGQLYRDRADCENGFDEINNQWGWGGYSTHDIERCALSARAVALVYNWWSWYVRLAHPKTRLGHRAAVDQTPEMVRPRALHRRANIGLRAKTQPRAERLVDWVTVENRINRPRSARPPT